MAPNPSRFHSSDQDGLSVSEELEADPQRDEDDSSRMLPFLVLFNLPVCCDDSSGSNNVVAIVLCLSTLRSRRLVATATRTPARPREHAILNLCSFAFGLDEIDT